MSVEIDDLSYKIADYTSIDLGDVLWRLTGNERLAWEISGWIDLQIVVQGSKFYINEDSVDVYWRGEGMPRAERAMRDDGLLLLPVDILQNIYRTAYSLKSFNARQILIAMFGMEVEERLLDVRGMIEMRLERTRRDK